MTKHAVIAITLLAVGALTAPVEGERNTQKLLAAACERPCPEGLQLAACLSEIALCQTKVGLYETYMSQLGAGASLKTLPAAYVQVLQPLYSGVTLQAYLYGYSPRQAAVATTDCGTTYYTTQSFVDKVAAGTLSTAAELKLLFHELEHYRQCMNAGGRSHYARMWFEQIPLSQLQTFNMKTIHDAMPMEMQASTRQEAVFTAVSASNRDASGRLVPSLQIALKRGTETIGQTMSAQAGSPMTLTAEITGGSQPIRTLWQWRYSTGALVEIGTRDSRTLTYTPSGGSGELLFDAFQETTGLRASRRVAVTAQVPTAIALPERTIADNVTLLRRTLRVTLRNSRGAAVQGLVCVGDSSDSNRLGQVTTSTAGVASFQLAANLPVVVTASATGHIGVRRPLTTSSADSALSITLVPGIGGAVCR